MFEFISFHLIRSAVAPNDYGLSSRGEEAEAIIFFSSTQDVYGQSIFFGLDLPIDFVGRRTQQEPSDHDAIDLENEAAR